MPVENHIYNERFFQNTIEFELESAAAFVDVVLLHYSPKSIVDIGCGAGIYLKAFSDRGIVNLLGIDGAPAAASEFMLDKSKLEIFDLSKKYNFAEKFDLALCLEVAEHLPEEDADVLVENIIAASDNILFTAATPGQGPRSIGHINEQPHQYWIDRFAAHGFVYQSDLSEEMRQDMSNKKVVWWIVNNLMVFSKNVIK